LNWIRKSFLLLCTLLLSGGCLASAQKELDSCRIPIATVHGVFSSCLESGGQEYLAGCVDGVRRINLKTGTNELMYKSSQVVTALSASSDGKYLAAASGKSVSILDLNTFKQLSSFEVSGIDVRGTRFLTGGHTLAVAGISRFNSDLGLYSIALWNADTGQRLWKSSLPNAPMYALAVSADGKYIAVGCVGGDLVLADAKTGQYRSYHCPADSIANVDFSPDSSTVIAGSLGGTCWVLPVSLAAVQASWKIGSGYLNTMAYSPDGTVVATTTFEPGAIVLWDPKTGKQQGHLCCRHQSNACSV
jgi:WD40 repeat protein